ASRPSGGAPGRPHVDRTTTVAPPRRRAIVHEDARFRLADRTWTHRAGPIGRRRLALAEARRHAGAVRAGLLPHRRRRVTRPPRRGQTRVRGGGRDPLHGGPGGLHLALAAAARTGRASRGVFAAA